MDIEITPQHKKAHTAQQRCAERYRMRRSFAGRDIGPIPPVVNPERREACKTDLLKFTQTYLGQIFYLPFCPDHINLISKMQTLVLNPPGYYAVAMPRGSGKTSLALAACLWSLLYGHSRFVLLIAASAERAKSLLLMLRRELEENELLLEDFPGICYPLRMLEGISSRAHGQHSQGRRTNIQYKSNCFTLPDVLGEPAAGSLVSAQGLTAQIRGLVHRTPDGRLIRPSLVLIDDPQTDVSAHSPAQCLRRESLINSAVGCLSGADQPCSIIMALTVIRRGDLADTYLDRSRYPQYRGDRCKLLYSLPTNLALWDEYAKLYLEDIQLGNFRRSLAFYRKNRKKMDEGAKPAWEHRYCPPNEISAVQFAMNLRIRDIQTFQAEYQNEPAAADLPTEEVRIRIEKLVNQLSQLPAGTVPPDCVKLTAYIDPHDTLHFYLVTAWTTRFAGYVIEYGTWPKQPGNFFTMASAPCRLVDVYNKPTNEAVLLGLDDLLKYLAAKKYPFSGAPGDCTINRILVDANYGTYSESIYGLIRAHPNRQAITPAHGRYVGAASLPFNARTRKPGDVLGWHWRLSQYQRAVRCVLYDTNFWKSFIAMRLNQPPGVGIAVYGTEASGHRQLFEHWMGEVPMEVTCRGTTLIEWKNKSSRPDQHWFDCLVGCAVAASIEGIGAEYQKPTSARKVRRVSLQEMYAEARRRQMAKYS